MVVDQGVPLLTEAMAGTGGLIKVEPEDFCVEEVPSYEPCGQGPHLYLWVEKTNLPAEVALRRLGQRFECRPGDVGQAGIKDTRARSRQWFSVVDEAGRWSAEADPAEMDLGPGLRVLRVSRHGNRLKTGHLRGNSFDVLVREAHPEGLERAVRIMAEIQARGLPNFYGPQRFGRDGGNVTTGLALLRGERGAGRAAHDRFVKRLVISAVQSHVFNRVLAHRMAVGLLHTVLEGDRMVRLDSGGRFEVQDPAAEQERFDRREVVHTAPMPGHRIGWAGGAAGQMEREGAAGLGIEPGDFKRFGKLALGARRESLIFPADISVEADSDGVRVRFLLPRGAYATTVLGELMKSPTASLEASSEIDEVLEA